VPEVANASVCPRLRHGQGMVSLNAKHEAVMAVNPDYTNITSVLDEKRVFPPPKDFSSTPR